MWKCASSIWHRDSKSRRSYYDSDPLTTKPGLPPKSNVWPGCEIISGHRNKYPQIIMDVFFPRNDKPSKILEDATRAKKNAVFVANVITETSSTSSSSFLLRRHYIVVVTSSSLRHVITSSSLHRIDFFNKPWIKSNATLIVNDIGRPFI